MIVIQDRLASAAFGACVPGRCRRRGQQSWRILE
jgi:hypothetical protein